MPTPINWKHHKNIDCVIICGGSGSRMLPLTQNCQKTMIHISRKPLLAHVVDYWSQFCGKFFFVAHYQAEQVEEFIAGLDIDATLIVEEKAEGIARAIGRVRHNVSDHFITVLGDCLCRGRFYFPPAMEQGIGAVGVNNPLYIHQSYSVEGKDGMVQRVVEKPQTLPNNDCGMGIYFFSKHVFTAIDNTLPSPRSAKVEITDVIQTMIRSNLPIHRVHFEGDYINVTRPEDILIASNIIDQKYAMGSEKHTIDDLPGQHVLTEHLNAKKIRRVLAMRTIPLPEFHQLMGVVKACKRIQALDILCQPGMKKDLAQQYDDDHIHIFPKDGLYRTDKDALGLIRRLRQQRYDAVLIPYNNPEGTGYSHLNLLGFLCGKSALGIRPDFSLIEINFRGIFRTTPNRLTRMSAPLIYYLLRVVLVMRRRWRSLPLFRFNSTRIQYRN